MLYPNMDYDGEALSEREKLVIEAMEDLKTDLDNEFLEIEDVEFGKEYDQDGTRITVFLDYTLHGQESAFV